MTFYTFENSELSDANQVNANFNELTYAILYNRMENDAQATAPQLNANIQSDLFCCAAGKYSTVCTADTTSRFSTNLYINYATYSHEPYLRCANYYCITCTGAIPPTSYNCVCFVSGNYVCHRLTAAAATTGNANCIIVNMCHCVYSGNLCLQDYNCTVIDYCFCARTRGPGPGSTAGVCYFSNFNGICCAGLVQSGTSAYCCAVANANLCFVKLTDSCYAYYLNTALQCCINPAVCEIVTQGCFCNFQNSGTCTTCAADSLVAYTYSIIRYNLESLKIQSAIKNYATPKGSVVLSTVSTLPAGNCIRYNIKDQAGTVLLCDAIPDAVYSLSSPANCLYAEIYQCVECNLCAPQCMTQYALMYM